MRLNRILLIIFLFSNVLFESNAQVIARADFEVRTYDTSANQFFRLNSNISHITIKYYNGVAQILHVFYKGKPVTNSSEAYTLGFDGDVHLFNKKYKPFPFPQTTVAQLFYVDGIEKLNDSTIVYRMMATIKPDSLRQHFSFSTVKGKAIPGFFPKHYRPTLKDGILPLTKKLEANYNQWKPLKVTDSIIIFTALVDRVGQIGKLTLVEGISSEYSTKVLDFLTSEATSWNPRFTGGGAKPSEVKISVRVNKDDSVKISIL